MEFCLDLSHHRWARANDPRQATEWTLETVAAADRAGLHSVWLSEDPDGWDAIAVAAAAAVRTERIRIGTGVTNPFLRHPVQIAMAIATLDRLSSGRAFLGLGRGQPEFYAHGLGIPVRRPLTAVRETVELLRQWWRPPHRATLAGTHFVVHDWPLSITPLQRPVPIYLAALGPKARQLAAELADGILIADFASEPFLAAILPELRAQLAAAGRDPNRFAVFVRTNLVLTDNPEPALEERKLAFALLATLPGMSQQVIVPGFDVERLVAELRQLLRIEEQLQAGRPWHDIRRAADPDRIRQLVPTELIAQLCLIGPADQLRARLARLAAIGVTHVFVRALPEPDPAAYRTLVETLVSAPARPES
ncbi:LLM class flavin-dependent oxidoreductase [Thermomicrobium sp. 4228-Ro]|uniref:LLM class flavin-dependent oxidoreductase n=1 Tax=Thermomicrobium sp. 4228-Ro TaxID=2993937 RepID=UPI0022491FCB|nr:LLM class flavin-dependent oxidoreductase [Thermomicrobium sp. 4228-Ro]MCX2726979.1 LLM class flavin-dependent oxidoreductase [Thermomicrobium sp. 4228-Ro]